MKSIDQADTTIANSNRMLAGFLCHENSRENASLWLGRKEKFHAFLGMPANGGREDIKGISFDFFCTVSLLSAD